MTKPSPKDISRLQILESAISHFDRKKSITRAESQVFDDYCRKAVRLYHGVISKTPDAAAVGEFSRFRRLAYRAMARLGGEGILPVFSLKDYDHKQFGPFLGVRDAGSAAAVIRKAALASPKVKALSLKDPLSVGVAVDAERLGGVGEVAVGPDEYINVRLECAGRILNSTNIGTRVNLRYYRRHPVVTVGEGDQEIEVEKARKDILEKFKPFLHALGGKPRPLTVYVEFGRKNRWGPSRRASVIKDLSRYAARPVISDRKVHRLGYQANIGPGFKGRSDAIRAIDIAAATGFLDVAICGRVRQSAEGRVSDPGLLNYLAPGKLGPVLRHANKLGIHLRPVNTVDPDTVARHIWSALHTAWQMGFELGKYGLFPLTLEESEVVISRIQSWFSHWTAVPVFFVDRGFLSTTRVDTHGDLVRGLKTWLEMVARNRVPVVLIDTMDKATAGPLLRSPSTPKGYLSLNQIAAIDRFARAQGVRLLWAGGITLPKVFDLGRLGVFGIYVTSAVASPAPVPPGYEHDPWLANVKEPTFEGVLHAKLLLEAGFLSVRLQNDHIMEKLKISASNFLLALEAKNKLELKKHQIILADHLGEAWRQFRPERGPLGQRKILGYKS